MESEKREIVNQLNGSSWGIGDLVYYFKAWKSSQPDPKCHVCTVRESSEG